MPNRPHYLQYRSERMSVSMARWICFGAVGHKRSAWLEAGSGEGGVMTVTSDVHTSILNTFKFGIELVGT